MTFSKKLPRVSNGFEIWCGEWSAQRTTSQQSFKQWEENFTQHWATFVRFWHWLGLNSRSLRDSTLHQRDFVSNEWKRCHHRLNVETLRELEFYSSQCQNRTNVVWSFLLTVWTTVRLCAELITRHIKNPYETQGSFFEHVISPWRILVPLHFLLSQI